MFLTDFGPRSIQCAPQKMDAMPKPRYHARHLCRTFYLSEWWDE